jgi:hypothetical protein
VRVHGWVYVWRESDSAASMILADIAPYHEESLKLLNASVMTFRKKK